MKNYKNVGVYAICRTHPKGDIEEFKRQTKLQCELFMDNETKNFEIYMDIANVGTVCERSNLKKLINDALSGAIDHICIISIWDLWHNPQRFIEVANMLRSLAQPIGITITKGINPHCPVMMNSLDNDSFDRMMYEVLELQKAEMDLMFLAANHDAVSKELQRILFTHRIDQDMLYTYLVEFDALAHHDKDWEDLQKEVELSDKDMQLLQMSWHPSNEGIDKIIKWGLIDILSYYLV